MFTVQSIVEEWLKFASLLPYLIAFADGICWLFDFVTAQLNHCIQENHHKDWEKKIDDKPALHEEKLEEIESKSLKKDTVKLSDDVSSLEAERYHLANTITTIDKALMRLRLK